MEFFKLFKNVLPIATFIVLIVVLIIMIIVNYRIKKLTHHIDLKFCNLGVDVDNLICGSKRVERITDAINQRTKSYIANCGEKKKQTSKKNVNSSKPKKQTKTTTNRVKKA